MKDDSISRKKALDTVRAMCDRCDTGDVLDYRDLMIEAFEALPSAQPSVSKTEIVGDAISRAAVVDTIEGVDWYHQNKSGEMVHGANSDEHQAWYKAEDIYKAIETVPSAQPDIPNINVIIDTIKNAIIASTGNDAYMVGLRNGMKWCWSALTDKEPEYEDIPFALPPAQQESKMEIYVSGYEKGAEESLAEVLNAFKKVRDELPEDKREAYTDDFCKIMGRMLDELEKKE